MKRNSLTVVTNLSPQFETKKSTENSTEVNKPTLVGKPTQVEEPSLVEAESTQQEKRRGNEQDSSVALESRASEGLEKGYTRIPNGILMKLVNGDFTRNEIKIALIIARFTISFRREFAPLSKKVLERQSGLRGPAVLEAVSGLVTKGLVKKQQGDQYRPNMLGLNLPSDWQCTGNLSKDEEVTISTPVTIPTKVENSTPAPVTNATPGEVQKPTPFKDIKIYKNNNSLLELPKELQKYFSELKPAKKRESEWRAFESLSQDFSAADIASCLKLLIDRGIKSGKRGTFQTCHSPMAYLTKAMKDVLAEVPKSQQTAQSSAEQAALKLAEQSILAERRAQEAREFAVMEEAFQAVFPSPAEQQAAIDDICAKNMPFPLSPAVNRLFAISNWWSADGGKILQTNNA